MLVVLRDAILLPEEISMPVPVKLTRSHQVTLPKRLLERAGWVNQEFFVADLKGGCLILKPLTMDLHSTLASFADLRRHFARIGITQRDVRNAVTWARGQEHPRVRQRRATH
ncbi:MAG: hypothetical protein Q8R91_01460 [Candidatus Omnitrophota bacterium]|nr:hypothetical protein [Candidatus Omnitrophota bacterium]